MDADSRDTLGSLPGSGTDHMIGHKIAQQILIEASGLDLKTIMGTIADTRTAQWVYFCPTA
jgi:hypothetical protein